jgi:hypothetical protein
VFFAIGAEKPASKATPALMDVFYAMVCVVTTMVTT